MGPIAQSDGHDAPGLIDELVPCVAAMIDDVVVGFEHAVGEPIVAQELPDVLGRIEFRAFGRQRHDRDVGGNVELVGHMPAGLIEQQHGMRAGGDVFGDFGEMQVHRIGVALGQDEGRALAVLRRDRAEDIGRGGALILRRGRTRSAFRPSPGDLVLLADTRLVREPDFYVARIDALFPRDFLQACGEVFLNSSIAPSRCA